MILWALGGVVFATDVMSTVLNMDWTGAVLKENGSEGVNVDLELGPEFISPAYNHGIKYITEKVHEGSQDAVNFITIPECTPKLATLLQSAGLDVVFDFSHFEGICMAYANGEPRRYGITLLKQSCYANAALSAAVNKKLYTDWQVQNKRSGKCVAGGDYNPETNSANQWEGKYTFPFNPDKEKGRAMLLALLEVTDTHSQEEEPLRILVLSGHPGHFDHDASMKSMFDAVKAFEEEVGVYDVLVAAGDWNTHFGIYAPDEVVHNLVARLAPGSHGYANEQDLEGKNAGELFRWSIERLQASARAAGFVDFDEVGRPNFPTFLDSSEQPVTLGLITCCSPAWTPWGSKQQAVEGLYSATLHGRFSPFSNRDHFHNGDMKALFEDLDGSTEKEDKYFKMQNERLEAYSKITERSFEADVQLRTSETPNDYMFIVDDVPGSGNAMGRATSGDIESSGVHESAISAEDWNRKFGFAGWRRMKGETDYSLDFCPVGYRWYASYDKLGTGLFLGAVPGDVVVPPFFVTNTPFVPRGDAAAPWNDKLKEFLDTNADPWVRAYGELQLTPGVQAKEDGELDLDDLANRFVPPRRVGREGVEVLEWNQYMFDHVFAGVKEDSPFTILFDESTSKVGSPDVPVSDHVPLEVRFTIRKAVVREEVTPQAVPKLVRRVSTKE